MKKYLITTFLVLSLILSLTACNREIEGNETTTLLANGSQTEAGENKTDFYDKTDIDKNETANDIGGGEITSDKYRQRYYSIPYNFILLVDREEFDEWENEIINNRKALEDTMRMLLFIKRFNISKEDFEKTNLEMAKDFVAMGEKPTMRSSDFENQQVYEIYNADIIYTFDSEIINEYYLTPEYKYCSEDEFEYFVEKGEYQSLVTVWVDVDELEAEIIAKYGNTEVTPKAEAELTTAIKNEETAGETSEPIQSAE